MAKGRSMAKTNPLAKRASETDLQWRSRIAAAKQADRDRTQPLVTPEAERHGDYETALVVDPEGHSARMAKTTINRGGDPVSRWIASQKLSQGQQAVIGMCIRLWSLAGLYQPVTAKYGHVVGGLSCYELRATTEIEARADLHRIQGYFPGPLKDYWNVFENVCRHGIPAGVAGETLGHGSRSAQDRAHQIVCFVADIVATREGI